MHIRPYVGKAKMCFWGGSLLEICKQTNEKCKQIPKKLKIDTASQMHFGFSNMGLDMHCF